MFTLAASTQKKKRAARSMLELRVQRGLASLDNNGGQLANQIGRNSRVLPALTYTCTDLHISHPGIYNSNSVARQVQTVAKRVHHSAPIYGILHGDLTQLQNLIKLKIHKINISNQIVRMYYSVN